MKTSMTYSPCSSGLGFGGRPGGGAFLITSKASAGYSASLLIGFKPALYRSFFTASVFLLSLSAISRTVRNSSPFISIVFIIGIISKNITHGEILLDKRVVEPMRYSGKFHQRGNFILT